MGTKRTCQAKEVVLIYNGVAGSSDGWRIECDGSEVTRDGQRIRAARKSIDGQGIRAAHEEH